MSNPNPPNKFKKGEPRPAGADRRPAAVNHLTTARVKTERKVRVVYQTVDEARAALRAKGIDPTVIECAMMPKFLLPKPLLTGMLCSAMLNEMGIKVVETEEAGADEEARERSESEETESGELVEVTPKALAKSEGKEPIERTDDPVRMYLREMGSIGLLSRQGEVAIAKRIEAGREAMIAVKGLH